MGTLYRGIARGGDEREEDGEDMYDSGTDDVFSTRGTNEPAGVSTAGMGAAPGPVGIQSRGQAQGWVWVVETKGLVLTAHGKSSNACGLLLSGE